MMAPLDIFQFQGGVSYMVCRTEGDWALMMAEHGTNGVEMTWRKIHATLCDVRWRRV